MACTGRRGFTLIELLVVITIIGILAAIALPNYIKAKDKAKEVQTKSAIKSIQVAVERYQVDQEEYPLWLLGGDVEGWRYWHQRYDEASPLRGVPQNAWVDDPLIIGGYLEAYPENPFVDTGTAIIASTGLPTGAGGAYQPGDGDPRFGFRGTTIGNGLEYPMTFRNWDNNPAQSIETERTVLTVTQDNPTLKGFATPVDDPRGMHYAFGGRKGRSGDASATLFTHWPGNFLYRGFMDRPYQNKGWERTYPTTFGGTEVNRYMLGGYGSYTSIGEDVARVATKDDNGNQIYYRSPPPWSETDGALRCNYEVDPAEWKGGLPELAGGGNETEGPMFPYDRDPDFPNAFIYGAPDGHPDAIILVLTPGDEVKGYE